MFITKKHMSRRTVLRGMGATMALPLLDAMVPAEPCSPRRPPAARPRLSASRWCTARRARTDVRRRARTCGRRPPSGRRSTSAPSSLKLARAVPRLSDHRQQHRRAHGRGVRAARSRRRPLPLERRVPDAGASRSRPGVRRARRHVDGSDLRAAVRPGHADSVDAAVHRERRSGRRLRLRLRLRLHRHDQLGGAERSRCRWCATRAWCSISCSASARRRRSAPRSARPTAASSTGSATKSARLQKDAGPGRPRAARRVSRRTSARSSGASSASKRATRSGEARELPEAPAGVPDSFDEHVKLMFDLQVLAFAVGHDARLLVQDGPRRVGRVYPESGVAAPFHPASHHGEREERVTEFSKINRYHVGLMPYFLEKLKDTPDGDGNLLDNTLVHLRLADGQLEHAQPQALPAVPRRPRRRRAARATCTSRPPTARRWPTSC